MINPKEMGFFKWQAVTSLSFRKQMDFCEAVYVGQLKTGSCTSFIFLYSPTNKRREVINNM